MVSHGTRQGRKRGNRGGRKKQKCPYCHRHFRNLQKHIQEEHCEAGQTPVRCGSCGDWTVDIDTHECTRTKDETPLTR